MTLATVPRYDATRVSTVGEHAVVAGASVAGLLAGRVLADGFERVTVLEHDPLPDCPGVRRGVPQADHVHVLQEAGRATIADLFPAFGERLLSAGGLLVDASSDLDYHDEGDFLAPATERLPMYCASRPLFEQTIRRLVTDHERVHLRSGCRVTGYRLDERADAVTGVDLGGDATALEADIVVDATGRTSRTPAWLEADGYPTPATEEVRVDLAYGTVAVERPPNDRRALLVAPSHPRTRGAAAIPVEGDRWLVTLFGLHGDHPPTDESGFVDFAAGLPTPAVADLVRSHAWVGDVDRYPFPANRRRRYEDLERFPDGLLVTGDAVASFNPIYGQGMSVAALDALQLHHALAGGRDGLAERFFDRVASVVDVVWRMAVGADFAFPQTEGPKPRGVDLSNRYVSRLVRTAHTDRRVSTEFARVLRLERPPAALLRPAIVRRVLLPG